MALDLLMTPIMRTERERATTERVRGEATVLIVGGSSKMSDRYRAIVEERGLVLRHFENRVPNGTRHVLGKVATVVIMVGMVSHALREQVQGLIPEGAPIVYLRSASVSALRAAVNRIEA